MPIVADRDGKGVAAVDGRPALEGLPPVLSRGVRVLILGSFPSAASLAAGEYYAHPYRQRLSVLLATGIGLWDAIVACRRQGSLDGAIRDATPGEVARVRRAAPSLALVCFNGQTAARALPMWHDAGYETLSLPSSSPAYTRPFVEKLAAWQAIGAFLRASTPKR
jgi:G:T/U-mismatch repair DNA glycosylase